MKDLIEALTLAAKYIKPGDLAERWPTHCEHDTLHLAVFDSELWDTVPEEEKARFDELGFGWSEDDDCVISYRFGSC